jgi:hypothetical protein
MTADLILLALGSILWMIGMIASEPMQDDIAGPARAPHAPRDGLSNSRMPAD